MTGDAAYAPDDRAEAIGYVRTRQAEHTYRVQAEALDEFAATCERLRAVKANSPFQRLGVEFHDSEALHQEHRAATTWAPP